MLDHCGISLKIVPIVNIIVARRGISACFRSAGLAHMARNAAARKLLATIIHAVSLCKCSLWSYVCPYLV